MLTNQVSADAIWLKGKPEPVYGWLLEQNESQVEFKILDVGGDRRVKFERSAIVGIVVNVDAARLERLKPTELSSYRDYAEELAIQKIDPVARELAVRLFLIASANSSGKLRQSALKGLISLASDEKERTKWTTLQSLADQSGAVTPVGASEKKENLIPDSARQTALRVVQLIRQGEGLDAVKVLNSAGAEEALRYWLQICSVGELKRIAQLNRPTLEQLHKVLQIELSVIKNESPVQIESATQGADWGEYALAGVDANGTIPTFRSATKFDPSKSLFRNGQWIRP